MNGNVSGSTIVGDGVPILFWRLLWLLGAIVATVSIAFDILVPSSNHIMGRDFTNLWVAGKLVQAGQIGCIFDPQCFRDGMHGMLGLVTIQNYSYPPTALFVAAPFGMLSYDAALITWTVGGIAFFVWCARPFLPRGFPPLLAALTPAGAINIWAGHYGFLLGGLWLLCFRSLERRPRLSGICAGLLTFKPHLGLMIAASMLRDRRALAAAVLTTIALVLLSAAAFGPLSWREFFSATISQQHAILTSSNDTFYFLMMPSAYVAYGRGILGIALQILFACAALGLLIWARRWDAFSAATATFLFLPYVFNYDMTVACLGFALFLHDRWSSLGWAQRLVVVLAFLAPELTYFADFLVPVALSGGLYLQLREINRTSGADDAPSSIARPVGGSSSNLDDAHGVAVDPMPGAR
ncbi:MAG TPA: glycosyltransferase family 87 protein [Sphingomicrobium sp.]|nr:glycosyltransferase family 87 protein [Sphingomicrobium sp.]